MPFREWRWIAGLAALLTIALGMLWLARHRAGRLVVRPVADVLPADGRERAVLHVARSDGGSIETGEIAAELVGKGGDAGSARIVRAGKEVEVWMRAPVMAGERVVRVGWGDGPY
jgi:hypothetical protein